MEPRVLIELLTNGCPGCEGWLAYGQELAGSAKLYELRVWDSREDRDAAEREKKIALYGITELPAIAVDSELLTCCR